MYFLWKKGIHLTKDEMSLVASPLLFYKSTVLEIKKQIVCIYFIF